MDKLTWDNLDKYERVDHLRNIIEQLKIKEIDIKNKKKVEKELFEIFNWDRTNII
jgi:hypothetical protein